MVTGAVLFYSIVKGQGIIVGDDHKEYKVKLDGLKGAGLRRLHEGQQVQFEIKDSPKGLSAVEVEIINP